jgi:cystathionine beta-lyase
MGYSFDEVIDRRGTNCCKWEFLFEDEKAVFGDHADPARGREQLLPLWVADMDFRCPQPVIDAIKARADHGIFGYSLPDDAYYDAVVDWIRRRYGWQIEKEWLVLTPGVVPAINAMVAAFVAPGEKVILQGPVYHPFYEVVTNNDAHFVSNSLNLEDGRYQMDFADLAEKAADPAVKMAILCSPHNPVGRVWTEAELRRFGEICQENDVLVVADEIHCDLIYSHARFTAFGSLGEAFRQKSIICTAASKSFNLAGLKLSNIIVPNEELRATYITTLRRRSAFGANTFGLVATQAAYEAGEPWLAAVMAYVEDNYRFMVRYLAEHLPEVRAIRPDGTYLVWVDFRTLGLAPAARKHLMMESAKVFLDEGEMFGPEGEGFERFNIACPRSILERALARICAAVRGLEM